MPSCDERCLVDYVGTYFKEQLEKMAIVPQAKPTPVLAR